CHNRGTEDGLYIIIVNTLNLHDNELSLGDLWIEPFRLGWHWPRLDLTTGLAIMAPTADRKSEKPALPGKNFWSTILILGGTYYLDGDRTWSVSPLLHYEFHSQRQHADVRAGSELYFEWAVSKNIHKFWEVGIAGSGQWQLSDDEGSVVTWDGSVHHRVLAIGPEVAYTMIGKSLFVSLRHEIEFAARDLPEGQLTVLTLFMWF
ncbi:MAG: transporter, partial [bacterium]